ncbi:MAG: pseudouridine synthase [Candidatus Hydrogenedentota bacterium]
MTHEPTLFEDIVEETHDGERLDVYLAGQIEDASRSFLKKIIKDGKVTINGHVCVRPGRTMNVDEKVAAEIPDALTTTLSPENIPIEIVYQDMDLLVVNKPAGLVVHPAPGHYSGTLLNAILFHCADFQRPGEDPVRPGIVHRIDRDTSGLLVIAKSAKAFAHLSEQAREHTFDRRYLAIVRGDFKEDSGRIVASIGRSLADRSRMTVTSVNSRDAATRFDVLERFGAAALVALTLETGRTHQIRVHLRFTGHHILGDPVYGYTDYAKLGVSKPVQAALEGLQGQALHAEQLGFEHPSTGERMMFTAPLPPDFQAALDALRGD